MSDDLKPLLLEVLKTVNAIKDDHEKRFDQMEEQLTELVSEQKQIKELLGVVRLKEIGHRPQSTTVPAVAGLIRANSSRIMA